MLQTELNRRRIMAGGVEQLFVDFGLPSGLLWATCNLGAEKPEDDGLYFSWGNTEGHGVDSGYAFSEANYRQTTGYSVSTDITPENDAATVALGGNWRMPTKNDFAELSDNTDKEWTSFNGINGYKFMKKQDHSVFIFIPAAGCIIDNERQTWGSNGRYWSASRESKTYSYIMFFSDSAIGVENIYGRSNGVTIRPVLSTQ